MATNTLPFACLRQQCSYRAKSLAHMESHIMHEHKVKPWECAEANCGMKCPKEDVLKGHVLAAHGRNPLRAELAANATIMRTVKDEVTRTRVGAGAGPARPAPRPGPPAPRPAPFALPVAAPAATTTTIDALERPLYFLYHGMPYGTGPDIPSGRR